MTTMTDPERRRRVETAVWLIAELARTQTAGADGLLEQGWRTSIRPVFGSDWFELGFASPEHPRPRRVSICRFQADALLSGDGPSVAEFDFASLFDGGEQ